MKCPNPKCPAPLVVEELIQVHDIKFCPECGYSLDTSLKYPEENKKQESDNQIEQEEPGGGQSSLEQKKKSIKRSTDSTLEQCSTTSCEVGSRYVAVGADVPAESVTGDGTTSIQDQASLCDTEPNVKVGADVPAESVHDDGTTSIQDPVSGKVKKNAMTSSAPVTTVIGKDKKDTEGNDDITNQTYNKATTDAENTSAAEKSKGKRDVRSAVGSNTSSLGNVLNREANKGGVTQSTSANDNQNMNENNEGKAKTKKKNDTVKNESGKKVPGKNDENGPGKTAQLNGNNQHQDGYFSEKPPKPDESQHPVEPQPKNNVNVNREDVRNQTLTSAITETSGSSGSSGSSGPKEITIVFHALLAPHFMFDVTKGDRVFVCGAFPFKGWNENQLQMTPIRLANGYVLIQGETTIPIKYAIHKFTYKYRVLKQESDRKFKYIWEVLVGYPYEHGINTNRCFYLPERFYKSKDSVWHQYDDGVFRQPGTWESLLNKLPLYNFGNPVEGRELAMHIMLPYWDSFGEENIPGKKRGSEVLETINQVVYCMKNAKRDTGGRTYDYKLDGFSLEQVMLSYIKPRLNLNFEIAWTTSDVQDQAKRLATSLAIAAIASNFVRKMDFNPTDEHLSTIFECLAINASLGQERLERILKILIDEYYCPKHTWKLLEGILELCRYTINHKPHINEWLLAVPLMHFLAGSSQPYDTEVASTRTSPDNSYWGTNELDFSNVQACFHSSPIDFLNRLKPMFEFDPLLRRTFLFALPLRDFGRCVKQGNFPPDEICWTLGRRLKTTDYISDNRMSSIDVCLNDIIVTVDKETEVGNMRKENSPYKFNIDTCISLATASQQMLDCFLKQSKEKLLLARTTLTLLAKTLSFIRLTKSQYNEEELADYDEFCSKSIAETSKKVRNCLEKSFTSNIGNSSDEFINGEFTTWSEFYDVKFSEDTLCLSWKKALNESLNSRIEKMDDMQRIDFYSKVNMNQFHKQVVECFKDAAFAAIKRIIKAGKVAQHAKAFGSLCLS